jgi:hypothetical protein
MHKLMYLWETLGLSCMILFRRLKGGNHMPHPHFNESPEEVERNATEAAPAPNPEADATETEEKNANDARNRAGVRSSDATVQPDTNATVDGQPVEADNQIGDAGGSNDE